MAELSYWQASARLGTLATETLPGTCDVLVVGAGLLGVATAYFLARSGVDVVVVERETIGAGATARNAGFVVSGPADAYPLAVARHGRITAREVWAFTLDNRKLLREVLQEEHISCDYREPGHLSLATSPGEWENHEQTSAMLKEDGIDSKLLDRAQLQSWLHLELAPSVIGARFAPEEGQLHSAKFVYGLARAAKARGARFVLGREALRLTRLRNSWNVAVGGGGQGETVSVERVICAVNAWLPRLVPAIKPHILPVRGQVLATAPLPRYFPCGLSADGGYQYWQQLPDGRIVLGGCRRSVSDREVGYDVPEIRNEVQHALGNYLRGLFPSLPALPVEYRWGGIMAFSPDALPLIGPVPGEEGLYVAGGFTGHGMPFGLRAGQQLALSCTQGITAGALAPFRLDRPTLVAAPVA